jgi:hypothetical protein
MKNLSKKQIRAKHLLAVWLFCLLGFGIVLAVATNFFTLDIQGTNFGNSDYFPVLLLGFIILGFLFFGLVLLVPGFHVAESDKM